MEKHEVERSVFVPRNRRGGVLVPSLDRSMRSRVRRLRQPSPIAAAHPRIARSRRGETIWAFGVLKSFHFALPDAASQARDPTCALDARCCWTQDALGRKMHSRGAPTHRQRNMQFCGPTQDARGRKMHPDARCNQTEHAVPQRTGRKMQLDARCTQTEDAFPGRRDGRKMHLDVDAPGRKMNRNKVL